MKECTTHHHACDCREARVAKLVAEANRINNKINGVTAFHRHGNPIPKRKLDDLANAQLEFEAALDAILARGGERQLGVPAKVVPLALVEDIKRIWDTTPYGSSVHAAINRAIDGAV